jgi:hypothetical protein
LWRDRGSGTGAESEASAADDPSADGLRDLFAEADITREEYIGHKRALMASLNGGLPQSTDGEAVLARAARLLADLGDLSASSPHPGVRQW